MVKSKSALLALIHQHLLQNGYGKSARELQIESGEKFATSKVTLRRVYKLWAKKSKKKKKAKTDGGKSKKPKADHESKKDAIAPQAKKTSGIKKNKDKKKMNLAAEADVKATSKMTSPSLNDKAGSAGPLAAAVLPDGNDSSDSEEGTASAKAAPVQAEQNDESSSSSDSEEETAKQERSKPLRATAAAKRKASRRKAEVKDTSESSDETDIDNPRPATVVPSSRPKTLSVGIKKSPEVAARSMLKSSQPADESSTEDSSESDQEPAAKKQATVLQSSQLQTPAVTTKQTSVVAKSKTPLKTTQPASESSEEESESDEEPAAKKPATVISSQPKTPAGGAKQAPALDKPKGILKVTHQADESTEEESDSDEEPTAKKTATALQPTQPKTPIGGSKQTAPMAKSKTPVKTPKPDTESSEEDSESDEELASKKPATALLSTQPTTPSRGSKQLAVMAKSKTPVKAPQPQIESSEEDSESDKEPASKEPATALPLTQPITPSGGSKQTAAMAKSKTPVKAPKPQSENSEEDSESDGEPASKKPATALPSTPTPKTSSGGSKQTAVMAKSKSPVKAPQPDSESSEEDSESDEEPASKKPAAAFPLAQPKTPSGGSKQTAAMAKSNTPVKTPQPDTESSEEDSESDEEPASKKPATALPSTQTPKTSSGGSKQTAAMSKSPVKAPQPDSESSEKDSESDEEPASKKPATALPSAQQKNSSGGSKLTAAMAKSKKPVKIETPDSESSEEDFESDEEPSSMITSALLKATPPPAAKFTVYPAVVAKQKAGGPTKPVPSTKLAAANQETSDSSESSDGQEEHTGAQVNTSIPTAVKTVQPKVSAKMKTPSVRSPVPGKTNTSSLQKQKQPDPKSSSDSSDSEEESAVMKVATPATVKVKQGHQTGKVVKTPLSPNPLPGKTNCTSMAKTPLQARDESSSDTSESDEDTAEKVPNKGTPKAAEHLVSSPLPAKEVKGKTRSLTQSPAVQKPATANISSSSSESDEEPAIKSPAATKKNLSQSSVGKTTTPTTMLQKKQESSSEESDSDEEESLKKVTASAGKTQKQTELTIRHTKLKSPSPAKSPVVTKPDDSSDETSSDSGDDLPAQGKGDATRSLASSQKLVGKMSSIDGKKKSAVSPTQSGGRKPEDSQPLLKITPPTITSPKRRRRASEKASLLDPVSNKTKKNKVKPDTIPEPPTIEPLPPASKGALLESEEETVLALLEGRSPKKTPKKKASKKAAETEVANVATAPLQNTNVPKKSLLPLSLLSSTWIPESPTSGDDESALPTIELPPLSDKKSKSSKKRKISEGDLKNQTHTPVKKAKADKKEKKNRKGSVEGASVTPKPKADKKKSEKDQSKKKTKSKEGKKNKEEKKEKAESVAPVVESAAVVESTDSGIGLSRPKKKRKK